MLIVDAMVENDFDFDSIVDVCTFKDYLDELRDLQSIVQYEIYDVVDDPPALVEVLDSYYRRADQIHRQYEDSGFNLSDYTQDDFTLNESECNLIAFTEKELLQKLKHQESALNRLPPENDKCYDNEDTRNLLACIALIPEPESKVTTKVT